MLPKKCPIFEPIKKTFSVSGKVVAQRSFSAKRLENGARCEWLRVNRTVAKNKDLFSLFPPPPKKKCGKVFPNCCRDFHEAVVPAKPRV